MKNIKEFSKLFDVNIPVKEHADYYIESLKKVNYKNIVQKLEDFQKLEDHCESLGVSVESYKYEAMGTLMKNIKESKGYNHLFNEWINHLAYVSGTPRRLDLRKENKNKIHVSIDMSSANYSVLREVDMGNELEDTWEDYCNKQGYGTLASSKAFRQIVFGNTNPKLFERAQHLYIMLLVDSLESLKQFLIFISHDEIIFAFDGTEQLDAHLEEITNATEKFALPTKQTIYTLQEFEKDMYVKSEIFNTPLYNIFKTKTLVNVPGNQFYMHFKQLILGGEVEERDLLFISDKKLAQWVFTNKYKYNQSLKESEHGC